MMRRANSQQAVAGLLLFAALSACVAWEKSSASGRLVEARSHSILVTHPGPNGPESVPKALDQLQDEQGNPVEYHMDVRSVTCGDEVCEIITVRLVWDALGMFDRYELTRGEQLTKRDHERFTDDDHEKLRNILSDPQSPLKEVDPESVVAPSQGQNSDDSDELDGITSATLLSDKSAYVDGAFYTSFTLWHWANSEAQAAARRLSAETLTNERLLHYLNSDKEAWISFAVEQLGERGVGDEATSQTIATLARQGNAELVDVCLGYFASRGAATYYGELADLFAEGTSSQRTQYLSSLSFTDLVAPAGFYDRLSCFLPDLESYHEIHLFLNLLQRRNASSTVVIANTVPLLDHRSFLIARRAFLFLNEQPLGDEHATTLATFQAQNANRL